MADGKLVFLRPATGSAKLVLGDSIAPAPSIPEGHIAIDAGFSTDLPASVSLAAGVAAQINAVFADDMPASVQLGWDANVSRGGIREGVRDNWQQAVPQTQALHTAWQQAQSLRLGQQAAWQQANPLSAPVQTHWQEGQRLRSAAASSWQSGRPIRHAQDAMWQEGVRLRATTATAWQHGQLLRHAVRQHYQENLRLRAVTRQHWQQGLGQRGVSVRPVWGRGVPVAVHLQPRWQEAMRPRAGVSGGPVPPTPRPPCYDPATVGKLVFDGQARADGRLIFICYRATPPGPQPGVVVPIRRTYIVLNSITLHRLDTGAELHAHGFSMSLDYGSWTWQWSASLHHDAEGKLGRDSAGDPPVVVATVNGIPFHLRLERMARDRRFLPTRWAVSGRGLAATLAAPWATSMGFANTLDRTAQQLAQDVLTINGVSLGWDLDWQIADWMVPAGAWALQGSYMDALIEIAGSVGGYVQPHNTDPVLRILPKYPHVPWDWPTLLTPDFELPAAVGEVEATEYLDKPAYNGIWLGGQSQGVFGPVIRAGTAGDVLAPQIQHPLITDGTAHRARGLAELSDTGSQEHVTLTMQVLPETGVITPGKVVRYLGHDKDYLGIVRATSINWSRPKLRQSITLETHA